MISIWVHLEYYKPPAFPPNGHGYTMVTPQDVITTHKY